MRATKPRVAPRQSAKSYSLWLLSRREWSAHELKARLVERGYSLEAAEDALETLKSHGLQSDERFAGTKARAVAARQGNWRVRQKLKNAGVDERLIEDQLDALAPELERAMTAARRFEGLPRDVATKTRFWRHLASRGFGSTTIRRAWEALCEQRAEEPEASELDTSDDFDGS